MADPYRIPWQCGGIAREVDTLRFLGNPEESIGKAEAVSQKAKGSEHQIKTFVLDTSVLLHNPNSLFVFQENNVVIPFAALEELDEFKSGSNDLARNARQCIRYFDKLRRFGRLDKGVRWKLSADGITGTTEDDFAHGMVRIHVQDGERPKGLEKDIADNRIIAIAYALMQEGERSVFVEPSKSTRVKSIHCVFWEIQKRALERRRQ